MTNTQKPQAPTPAQVAQRRIERLIAEALTPKYTSESK